MVSDLSRLREKCRRTARKGQGPFTGKLPIDALRHQYAHAMQLDVAFQPLNGWFPLQDKCVKTHAKWCLINRHINHSCNCKNDTLAFGWGDNPVWVRAPRGALNKARRLCSVLNAVVTSGYLVDLSHDLMRIAQMIWVMSQRDFSRLCRRIEARIAQSVRNLGLNKSPEPVELFAKLTTNPTGTGRVNWVRPRRSEPKGSVKYVPRYVPPFRRIGFKQTRDQTVPNTG